MDGTANNFPAKKCARLQDFVYTIPNTFRGDTPWPSQKRRPRCLNSDTNFRSARQRSHCFLFTKRPLCPNRQ